MIPNRRNLGNQNTRRERENSRTVDGKGKSLKEYKGLLRGGAKKE
jgi:hypothetical protein